MQISINKKGNDDHLKNEFFKSFSSKFSSQGRVGNYSDKSISEFCGASFRFIGGKFVKDEGPSSSTKIKITLEFEPKANVDINTLESEIRAFLEKDFNLDSTEYTLEDIYSSALKYN